MGVHRLISYLQLRGIDYPSLFRLRRVSRRFNAIATPVVYRTLELSDRLVATDAHLAYAAAFGHIAHFTRHVVIHSGLDPVGIRRVLQRTGLISTITFVSPSCISGQS